MPREQQRYLLALETWPGVCRMNAPFDRRLHEIYKGPNNEGPRWYDAKGVAGVPRSWYVPATELPVIFAKAEALGYITRFLPAPRRTPLRPLPDDLLPHQAEAVLRAIDEGAILLQWDTGCGKTRAALETMAAVGGKAIVIAPRSVVSVWRDQAERWGHTPFVTLSKSDPTEQPDRLLISYGELPRVLSSGYQWDVIVYDELHYVMHSRSARTTRAAALSLSSPGAVRVGLTATPVSVRMDNIHSQLHVLCPHRYGTHYQWTQHYHHITHDGYEGARVVGPLRDDRLAEFSATLAEISSAVTQADLGDALPPTAWEVIKVAGNGAARLPNSLAKWRAEQTALVSRRADAIGSEVSKIQGPVCVVTYLRATAKAAAESLGADLVTGELPAATRSAILKQSNNVVCTMMAIAEGLDMRRFTSPIIAEPYPVPRYMEQVIGRFVRLFATEPVTIKLLRLEGTSDEIIADRLVSRMKAQASVLKESRTRQEFKAALTVDENSDTFLKELREQFTDCNDEEDGWE